MIRWAEPDSSKDDRWLCQLMAPLHQVPGSTYGPLTLSGDVPSRAFMLLTFGSSRFYAVRRSGAVNGYRCVGRAKPLACPPPDVPGVAVAPVMPSILTANVKMDPNRRIRIIASDYRKVDPSSYSPAEYRQSHSIWHLPHLVSRSGLTTGRSGWYRLPVKYVASYRSLPCSMGPVFEAEYRVILKGEVRARLEVFHFHEVEGSFHLFAREHRMAAPTLEALRDGLIEEDHVEKCRALGRVYEALTLPDEALVEAECRALVDLR